MYSVSRNVVILSLLYLWIIIFLISSLYTLMAFLPLYFENMLNLFSRLSSFKLYWSFFIASVWHRFYICVYLSLRSCFEFFVVLDFWEWVDFCRFLTGKLFWFLLGAKISNKKLETVAWWLVGGFSTSAMVSGICRLLLIFSENCLPLCGS